MIVFLLLKTLSIKFVVELRANFIINFKTFKPMKTKLRKINLEALSKTHVIFEGRRWNWWKRWYNKYWHELQYD